ncbi:conserved Plasmodium protein, unknown function [Plasmodium berghei]|uniref:Uncharacterized protein n=2 Tax=Plasmodium berghei TaxID=5821 RepID=A0A509AMH8_PLABA|nr:conserved Plasmodium protein, unknown function [Plasmodium berghei ANKA]CXI68610.1 conserved Plasmodium protein, unknown function [Plasmodium berghei]SCM24203.1 conserved Plasmodium protein, unknown function [Plasmodium berghei]SCN26986.1 conserved Plasmodium protein, unknown function [Plasmodium berghei]SCO61430.1 conserved Plasmodium protein, unknown function [Plasmodium berghei]SCO63407.1 conserved Plasmodium protein, unknown function [Plasmodium berghei]|eukprot:XP_034422602.1 conserved Plasmodium protein, unknown function [Plasmodium berghei ANKA]
MNTENILNTNCNIIDKVCKNLIEILENLENVLHNLKPLNAYENKDDDIFSSLNDKRNDIIVLSNLIYNNINKVRVMLHNFIKTIPPSYTYYNSFHYTNFVKLKEKKVIDHNTSSDNINLNNQQITSSTNNYKNRDYNMTEQVSYEEDEHLYFSFLTDLEYSNLLSMKKYEDKLREYLLNS